MTDTPPDHPPIEYASPSTPVDPTATAGYAVRSLLLGFALIVTVMAVIVGGVLLLVRCLMVG